MAKVKKRTLHTPDPAIKKAEEMIDKDRRASYTINADERREGKARFNTRTWVPEPRDPNKPPTKAGKHSK